VKGWFSHHRWVFSPGNARRGRFISAYCDGLVLDPAFRASVLVVTEGVIPSVINNKTQPSVAGHIKQQQLGDCTPSAQVGKWPV
jgi:hypothetical protein